MGASQMQALPGDEEYRIDLTKGDVWGSGSMGPVILEIQK